MGCRAAVRAELRREGEDLAWCVGVFAFRMLPWAAAECTGTAVQSCGCAIHGGARGNGGGLWAAELGGSSQPRWAVRSLPTQATL